MDIKVILVKAFTTNKDAGNPAGVILGADNLSTAQMQTIATQLGFSESVFVCKSEVADYKMRFFSVTQEVDYCAHATVAAAHVLKEIKSHETKAGVFNICHQDDFITLTQKTPEYGEYITKEAVANALVLDVDDVKSIRYKPQVVSTGVPKLIVYVRHLDILLDMEPDFEEIKRLCGVIGARGVYVFTEETIFERAHYHARQFNPLSGINEDPVTGIAAGALGAYIANYEPSESAHIVIEQGYSMYKFGMMAVSVVNKELVLLKGQAVVYGEQIITL